jgi:outer membrane cobalamin receptor
VGGYSNTNLSADYEVSRKVSVYLRGDNLFDSSYREYIGFPNAGMTMRVGIEVRALAK